eukprot:6036426-Amphidinium_carterae.1
MARNSFTPVMELTTLCQIQIPNKAPKRIAHRAIFPKTGNPPNNQIQLRPKRLHDSFDSFPITFLKNYSLK